MAVQILQGDARKLDLDDASVDLIVTSPPYWALRSYTDGGEHYDGQIGAEPTPAAYVDSLIDCTREWVRVLKPTGSIFVNLGDKYGRPGGGADVNPRSLPGAGQGTTGRRRTIAEAGTRDKCLLLLPERYRIACVDQLGLIARAVLIWDKPNGLPESVKDRARRSHEDWVHLVKEPHYFSAIDAIREAHAADSLRASKAGRRPMSARNTSLTRTGTGAYAGPSSLGRTPSSVWRIAVQPLKVPAELGISHFAAFPMEWPRRIVLGWSPQGGVVLDPFGGTGTTAMVAGALGRDGISVDLSADYCRLAEWRTSDPAQLAKVQKVISAGEPQ